MLKKANYVTKLHYVIMYLLFGILFWEVGNNFILGYFVTVTFG